MEWQIIVPAISTQTIDIMPNASDHLSGVLAIKTVEVSQKLEELGFTAASYFLTFINPTNISTLVTTSISLWARMDGCSLLFHANTTEPIWMKPTAGTWLASLWKVAKIVLRAVGS